MQESWRVALLTPYDGGNLGDSAIQAALIANLRRCEPHVDLCGITLHPARTSARHQIPCYSLTATSRSHYRSMDTKERDGGARPWSPRLLWGCIDGCVAWRGLCRL